MADNFLTPLLELKVPQLKAYCDRNGIPYRSRNTRPELQQLVINHAITTRAANDENTPNGNNAAAAANNNTNNNNANRGAGGGAPGSFIANGTGNTNAMYNGGSESHSYNVQGNQFTINNSVPGQPLSLAELFATSVALDQGGAPTGGRGRGGVARPPAASATGGGGGGDAARPPVALAPPALAQASARAGTRQPVTNALSTNTAADEEKNEEESLQSYQDDVTFGSAASKEVLFDAEEDDEEKNENNEEEKKEEEEEEQNRPIQNVYVPNSSSIGPAIVSASASATVVTFNVDNEGGNEDGEEGDSNDSSTTDGQSAAVVRVLNNEGQGDDDSSTVQSEELLE